MLLEWSLLISLKIAGPVARHQGVIMAQLKVYNPATGVVSQQIQSATTSDIEAAVALAKSAFPAWAQTPALKRARVLFSFKELLEKNIDTLAAMVTREHGKVLDDARGSVLRGIELVEFMCGAPHLLKGQFSENVANDIDTHTIRQPLGICLGVTPFNFPVMVPIWMMIPAIACGNTFILKPSEKDPSAPLFLAELLQQAGLPEGVLQVLNGDKTVVEQLLHHPDIVAASCVGSTPVAQYIYETAIKQGKRAQAFGGAKNHCIVMPDANLQEAASAIAGAAFGSAGERCMALSAVVAVGDVVADGLVEQLTQHAQELIIGPGDNATSQIGPLISAEHKQKVVDYIALGEQEGAQLIVDGRTHACLAEAGFFLGASLFDRVTSSMRIYREEIFGPVLVVLRAQSFSEALELINQHEFGNGTAIFTSDGHTAREFATQVQVGMVGINVPIPVPVSYHSFGGWKASMFGDIAMHGDESIRFYTKPKTVTSRWPKNAALDSGLHMPAH